MKKQNNKEIIPIVLYKVKKNKSKSGVEYIHYEMIIPPFPSGYNRSQRRQTFHQKKII